MSNNTNYQSAIIRIKGAKTVEDLLRVEAGLDRVYNCGFFTTSEFYRLCDLALCHMAKLDS